MTRTNLILFILIAHVSYKIQYGARAKMLLGCNTWHISVDERTDLYPGPEIEEIARGIVWKSHNTPCQLVSFLRSKCINHCKQRIRIKAGCCSSRPNADNSPHACSASGFYFVFFAEAQESLLCSIFLCRNTFWPGVKMCVCVCVCVCVCSYLL